MNIFTNIYNFIKFNKKKLLIIAVIAITLSVIAIVYSLGKYVGNPFLYEITLESVHTSSTGTEGTTATIDQSRQRLSIYKNDQLLNSYSSSSFKNPCFYDDCIVATDAIYVQQYSMLDYINYYEYEELVKYDLNGNLIGTVYKIDYDFKENRTQRLQIKSLSYDDAYLYIYCIEPKTDKLIIKSIPASLNTTASQEDIKVQYLPDFSTGTCPLYFTYDFYSDTYIITDTIQETYKYNPDTNTYNKIGSEKIDRSTKEVKVDLQDNIIQISYTFLNNKTLGYSPTVLLRILTFWIGIFIILIIGVLNIALFIRKIIKKNNLRLFKRITITFIVVMLGLLLVETYDHALHESSTTNSKNATQMTNEFILDDEYNNLKEILITYNTNGMLDINTYKSLTDWLESKSYTTAKFNCGIAYSLYAIHDQKAYIVAESSKSSHNLIGEMMSDDFQIYDQNSDYTVYEGSKSSWGDIYALFTPIYNDNKLVGFFASGYEILNIEANFFWNRIKIFISFVSLAIGISFIFLELKSWASHLIKRRKLAKKSPMYEISMCRIFHFLGIATSSTDSALIVLVVKDMLGTQFEGDASLILSLPLVSFGIGYLVGTTFYAWFKKTFQTRNTLIIYGILCTLSYAMCCYAVWDNNVFLLLIFLTLATIFNQGIVLYSKSIPIYIKNQKSRSFLNRENSASQISAYALATLAAGYVSTAVGNYCIYVLSVIVAIVCLFMVISYIPKNSISDIDINKKSTQKSSLLKDGFKFLRYPLIFVSLFAVVLSMDLASGYKVYIFPLYANDAGLSKITISNIVVFCNAIAYYISNPISKLENKLGSTKVMFISLVVLGFPFLLFLVNSNYIVSILVLATSIFAIRILQPSYTTFWQNYAVKIDFPKDPAVNAMNTITSVSSTFIKGPLTSYISTFGAITASIIIGVYVSASTLVLKLVSNKQNK